MKAMLFIGTGDIKVDTTTFRYNRVGVGVHIVPSLCLWERINRI